MPLVLGETNVDFTYLTNFGVLGLLALALLTGVLWSKPSVDRIINELAEVKAQRDALLKLYDEKVIPVLADVTSKVVPALGDVAGKVHDLEQAFDELREELIRGTGP